MEREQSKSLSHSCSDCIHRKRIFKATTKMTKNTDMWSLFEKMLFLILTTKKEIKFLKFIYSRPKIKKCLDRSLTKMGKFSIFK